MSSSDPLFHRALLFSLAVHLATLAWVQTPKWEMTPPPLIIDTRLESIPETAAQPPISPPPTPIPLPTPVPVQVQTHTPPPMPASSAVVAPVLVQTPVSMKAVSNTPVLPVQSAQPVSQPPGSAVAMVAAQPVVPEAPRSIQDSEYYPVRKLDTIPRRLGTAQPKYPESARRDGVTGSVKVRLQVNVLGEVETVEIISARPEGVFDETAEAFFKAARYQPPQREGRPVRAVIEERISFTLQDDF